MSQPEAQPSASIEERVSKLEGQLKKLEDIVREHFAAPDHQTNTEPLRELQESSASRATDPATQT
jgi:hypothetical protein